MSLDRVKAQGFLGVLVTNELRQKGIEDSVLAHKAGVHPKLISDVKLGRADQHRQEELRRLIRVLFLSGTKRRVRAYRLLFIIVRSRRSLRSREYDNRKRIRRGKSFYN